METQNIILRVFGDKSDVPWSGTTWEEDLVVAIFILLSKMHGLEPGPPPLPITWDLISNSHVLFLDPQCTIGIYFFPWWFLVYITVKETLVLVKIS